MANTPFPSEREMQAWFESALEEVDGLLDLIRGHEGLDNLETSNPVAQRIQAGYLHCLKALTITESISFDKNVSIDGASVLRPDAVLYSLEAEALVIVELKNRKQPTRESGTELGAYAAALRGFLPTLPDADIMFAVISTEWPTLLRYYISNEVFWAGRNVLCLQPQVDDGEIYLQILPPDTFAHKATDAHICDQHLGGLHLSLEDYSSQAPDRLEAHLPNMKQAMQIMAATGQAMKGHGFCVLTALRHQQAVAPYVITVVQFAPFRMIERLLRTKMRNKTFFKQLAKIVCEYDPTGQSAAFMRIVQSGSVFLKGCSKPTMEGFFDWKDLQHGLDLDRNCRYFQGWGIFAERYAEAMAHESQCGPLDSDQLNPKIGLEIIRSTCDPNYEFIDMTHLDLGD